MKKSSFFSLLLLVFISTVFGQSYTQIYTCDFDDYGDFKSKWTNVYPFNHEKISTIEEQTDDLQWSVFNPPANVKKIISYFAYDNSAVVEDGILHLKHRIMVEGNVLLQDSAGYLHTNYGHGNNTPEPRLSFSFDPKERSMLEVKVKIPKTPGRHFEVQAIPEKIKNVIVFEGENWFVTSPHSAKNNVNENGWCLYVMNLFDFIYGGENSIIPGGTTLWTQFDSKNTCDTFEVPLPLPPNEFYGTAYEHKKKMKIDDKTWYDQWHILKVLFDSEGFTTYIDDQQWAIVTYNQKGAGAPQGNYQLSLSYTLHSNNHNEINNGKKEIDDEWKEVLVDYVRFYKEEN